METPSRIGCGSLIPNDGANCGALVGVTEGTGVKVGRSAAVGGGVAVAGGLAVREGVDSPVSFCAFSVGAFSVSTGDASGVAAASCVAAAISSSGCSGGEISPASERPHAASIVVSKIRKSSKMGLSVRVKDRNIIEKSKSFAKFMVEAGKQKITGN